MALNLKSPTQTTAPQSAASALPGLSGSRGAKGRRGVEADEGVGFAAELERAKPADESAAGADVSAEKPDGVDKPASKDAKKTAGAPDSAQMPDPAAPPSSATPVAATTIATTMFARKSGDTESTGGALGALRKGGGRSVKDAAAETSLAAVSGKEPQLMSKGTSAVGEFAANATGAANSATDTRDSLAAFLPSTDAALAVQAGAVGASPQASLDAATSSPAPTEIMPAQATLPMLPQSPAFAPALGHQIEVWMRDGIQNAEVQLNPQELGPIRVRISLEGATTRVDMVADVSSTRDALQQALPQLSESLGQLGLSLSGGGVSDQSAQQSQAQERAFADGSGPGAARSAGVGRTRGDGGSDEGSGALSAASHVAQRRGLLDLYA